MCDRELEAYYEKFLQTQTFAVCLSCGTNLPEKYRLCRRCQEEAAREEVAQMGLVMFPECVGVAVMAIECRGLEPWYLGPNCAGPHGWRAGVVAKMLACTGGERCSVSLSLERDNTAQFKRCRVAAAHKISVTVGREDNQIIAIASNEDVVPSDVLKKCLELLGRRVAAVRRKCNIPRLNRWYEWIGTIGSDGKIRTGLWPHSAVRRFDDRQVGGPIGGRGARSRILLRVR